MRSHRLKQQGQKCDRPVLPRGNRNGANNSGYSSYTARTQTDVWVTTGSKSELFPEWLESHANLSQEEQRLLDRVKANFGELMEDPPMLENTVKMVVLAPLLDMSGFYYKPFRIETETSVDVEMEDEGVVIRGRIDVLVLKNRLWLLVIEPKRSDFAVTRAIPQALAYMLGNRETAQPTFGMITNEISFCF